MTVSLLLLWLTVSLLLWLTVNLRLLLLNWLSINLLCLHGNEHLLAVLVICNLIGLGLDDRWLLVATSESIDSASKHRDETLFWSIILESSIDEG